MDHVNAPEVVNATPLEPQATQEIPIVRELRRELSQTRERADRDRRGVLEALYPDTGGNLVAHARRELELAGLTAPDADYGGMVAADVVDLMRVFAAQGHSGGSAALTIRLFELLASFDVLSPLTAHPAEWMEVGTGVYQNRRKSSVFWNASEATWHDIIDRPMEVAAPPNPAKPG